MRRKPGSLVPLEVAICSAAATLHQRGAAEFHGYEMAKTLGDAADTRLLTAYGTLYRALGRLEKMGLRDQPLGRSRRARRARTVPDAGSTRLTALGEAAAAEARRAEDRRSHRTPAPAAGPRMNPLLTAPSRLVRGWTRLYTLQHGIRRTAIAAAREIESDLWEFHEDARRRGYLARRDRAPHARAPRRRHPRRSAVARRIRRRSTDVSTPLDLADRRPRSAPP